MYYRNIHFLPRMPVKSVPAVGVCECPNGIHILLKKLGIDCLKQRINESLSVIPQTPIVLHACLYQSFLGEGCCLDIEALIFGSVQHLKSSGYVGMRRTEWSNMMH